MAYFVNLSPLRGVALKVLALFALLWVGASAHAQDGRWPATAERGDASATSARSTERSAEAAPASTAQRTDGARTTTAQTAGVASTQRASIYNPFPALAQSPWMKVVAVALLFLVGYALPAAFFRPVMTGFGWRPGPAAAFCLGLGCAVTVLGFLAVMAEPTYDNGQPVPFYLQSAAWGWAAIYVLFFVVLMIAAVATARARPRLEG